MPRRIRERAQWLSATARRLYSAMRRQFSSMILRLAALLSISSVCTSLRQGLKSRALPPPTNAAPTIGILAVPLPSLDTPCGTFSSATENSSCFATFYPRWVESAGARAVLIPYDIPLETLDALLDSVNGVLLTGGGLEQDGLAFDAPYMVAAARVFNASRAKTDAGIFFPVHGSCQGMQVLSLLAAQDQSVLSYYAFDAEDLSMALDVTWDGHHSSRLLSAETAPPDVVATLMNTNSTLNLHHDGVFVSTFAANEALGSFYILVSTNFDRVGAAFVSTIEAWDYPITATQWHPERPQFEWREGNGISHMRGTITAMQYVANFFVDDARRNNQNFTDPALLAKYSVYSMQLISASDAATSGYQWFVFTD